MDELPGTAAQREFLAHLAGQVVVERLERATVIGHTKSGRVILEHGPPGPATTMWFQIRDEGGLDSPTMEALR